MPDYLKNTNNQTVLEGLGGTASSSNGQIIVSDTTQCIGTNSGALQCAGGAYIAKDMFVSGTLNVPTVSGTTVYALNAVSSDSGVFNSLTVNSNAGTSVINGMLTTTQTSDTIFSQSYSASLTVNVREGMVRYISSANSAITALTVTNIPIQTGTCSYVITLIIPNGPYHFNGTTFLLKTTDNTQYTVSMYGSVTLPTSYTYLMQTIVIMNIGGVSPTWKALNTVQAF